jgi:septal ring factor EnvC (AmiA/AmiB activator)
MAKGKSKKLDKIIADLAKMKSEIKTLRKLHGSLAESISKLTAPAAKSRPAKSSSGKTSPAKAPSKAAVKRPAAPVLVPIPDPKPADARPAQDEGRPLRAAGSPKNR